MAAPTVRGYLVVTVAEATGRNKEEDEVWDAGFHEGYVKVEVRGSDVPTCKSSSSIKRVLSGQISWQEDVVCEVLDGANELRVMLCKQKKNSKTGVLGQSVVAACGIYVEDILDAVPIDKYFEMFKPKNGGDGGFIRVAMNFSTESPDDAADLCHDHVPHDHVPHDHVSNNHMPHDHVTHDHVSYDHVPNSHPGMSTEQAGDQGRVRTADTDAAPYLPSTNFKSYSKEYNATSANGREIEQDLLDDEARSQDDAVNDDPIDTDGDDDDDLIDSTDRPQSKPAANSSDPVNRIDTIDCDHPIDDEPQIERKRPIISKRQTESKSEDDDYTADTHAAASDSLEGYNETPNEKRGANLVKILIGGAVAVGLAFTQRRR